MSSDLTVYQQELEPNEKEQLDAVLEDLRTRFKVVDERTHAWASDLLLKSAARAKGLEEKRKELTAPILKVKASIDGLFNPVIEKYEQATVILKAKVAEYVNAVEAQRRAIMQASAAEHAAGGTPTAIIPEPAKIKGVSVRKVWDFEIVKADDVPRQYCTPEGKLIRAAIKLGVRSIPGVRIFERDQVAARTAGGES